MEPDDLMTPALAPTADHDAHAPAWAVCADPQVSTSAGQQTLPGAVLAPAARAALAQSWHRNCTMNDMAPLYETVRPRAPDRCQH